MALTKFDASYPHAHGRRMNSQAKEAIEKTHDEPDTRKKQKANAQGKEADEEGDESNGHRINKPGDQTLEVHIIVIGGLVNRVR